MSILSIVGSVAAIVAGVFAWKTSGVRQRRMAENDVAEKEEKDMEQKAEIRDAVYNKNDAKVNELVSRFLIAFFVAGLLSGCTSAPTTVYIPTDRRIESCTNSIGIACKAVPDAVFCELLERAAELKALKTELAVDKRIAK